MKPKRLLSPMLAFCLCIFGQTLFAQTTEFTYQGSLRNSGLPANGNFDFEFALFDAISAGTQFGAILARSNVAVANGIFSVSLDFGSQFPGADRFLEIRVRASGQPGITVLAPRQLINSAPYSVRSTNATNAVDATNATTANNALSLGGLAANQYVVTSDPRMSDARNPLPGNSGYIQNRTTTQSASNFNISGTGNAGILNAGTQYNIGGSRILGVGTGTANTFGGVNSGANASSLSDNNTFFGNSAGQSMITAGGNSFFGFQAGTNTTSGENSFFGSQAGLTNTTGTNNSFFGVNAGRANTTADDNSFFGRSAGTVTTTGNDNSFFGRSAGIANTTGFNNTFVGSSAGSVTITGNNNTYIGANANSFSSTMSFATAIGSGSDAYTSNSIALGRDTGEDTVAVWGPLKLFTLASGGSSHLCMDLADQVAFCSSSLRYKTNIGEFPQGLSFVNKLRPISFDWKDGGMKDVGFGAEDVAKIDPRFVTYNDKGHVEGVKYDRLSVAFVNAFKEQQTQIEAQQKQIDELKAIVCSLKPDAAVCAPSGK